VDRRTFARRAHPVRVVPSVNGADAAAIGGAALVLQSELTGGRPEEGARPVPATVAELRERYRSAASRPTTIEP
jgi:hypothetical protein